MVLDALHKDRGVEERIGGDASSRHARGISEFSQFRHAIPWKTQHRFTNSVSGQEGRPCSTCALI